MGNNVENILLGFSGNDEVIRIADLPIDWGILPSGLSRCFPTFNLDLFSLFELVEELFQSIQGNVGEKGRNDTALGRTTCRWLEDSKFNVTCFQPLFNQLSTGHIANGLQQIIVADVVKCPLDVGT
jgi:hypothetical protein